MTGNARLRTRLLAALLALLGCARLARAGGGPENLFLLVNANSWASVTVANQFVALRQIPPINVFYVDWKGNFESTDGETFRNQILAPALEAMQKRGLFHQIDYVIYSSDFPYSIDLAKDYPPTYKPTQWATPRASINSATYFWHIVRLKAPVAFELGVNQYMRGFTNLAQKVHRQPAFASHGFHSWYGWGGDGRLIEAGGQPYMLSTMLAYTSGRGNSVAEALSYLQRSAAADGTFPKGTIYFTRTSDVRSTSRQDEVPSAMAELEQLGVASQVITTPMPMQASNVQGLMCGVIDFSWPATRSTILPGAICDNFTSFGGILLENASQTPLTEFLRYGAAGSAGTIVEPLSIAQKFASPNIFVHYARGCTLAESYYQSLFGPAQVLIVGDPLCRPWANIPQVRVGGVQPAAKVSGTLTLKPEARLPREGEIARYALFIDGRLTGAALPGEELILDSTTECDGYHELRVVAIAAGPIETQGRAIIPIVIDNHGRTASMATRPAESVRWGEALQVAVRAPGARQIAVLNNGRLLGTIAGAEGQLKVDPRVLGLGPVDLQAVGLFGSGPLERVVPPPVRVTVNPAQPLPAQPRPKQSMLPGMTLKLANERLVPVQDTRDPAWLAANGVGPDQPYAFEGYFTVAGDAARHIDLVHQFQVAHYGDLQLAVDGQALYRGREGKFELKLVPVALAPGLHRLTVVGKSGTDVKLRILFGGPGALSLNGRDFQHPKQQ